MQKHIVYSRDGAKVYSCTDGYVYEYYQEPKCNCGEEIHNSYTFLDSAARRYNATKQALARFAKKHHFLTRKIYGQRAILTGDLERHFGA